ncbi:MAG: DUF1028 domain-containing protein [Betaproteobacteria bacterium]
MRRIGAAILFVLCAGTPASATWSVIALDQKTGAVIIASATCVAQKNIAGFPAKDLRDIQAIVVPGKGVAAAQAGVDRTRANQKLIFAELEKGTDPARILDMLRQDPDIESRQFGILDMQGRHANFDGAKNSIASLHEVGNVPGTGIWYSIQGNILASDNVVHAAAAAFEVTRGTLADRVMAAMEAADGRGGDRRCTCDSEPKVDAPCDAKTAHVAYILQAGRADRNGASFNDGRYAMYLSVTNDDIKPTENANPVKTLRMRYDAWKRAHSASQ